MKIKIIRLSFSQERKPQIEFRVGELLLKIF